MDVADLKVEMDRRFEQVDRRFERLEQQVSAEGVATRRHFDIVVEKIIAERNLALDQSTAAQEQVNRLRASNASDHVSIENRLDVHERQISKLEKP
jgi:hypothetical protein